MMIIERWGALEADFLRYYNISNPLEVHWQKFLRLTVNMPFKDSVFFTPMYLEAKEQAESGSVQPKDNSDRAYYKRELDKKRGREGRVREQVSLDKFMEDIGRN